MQELFFYVKLATKETPRLAQSPIITVFPKAWQQITPWAGHEQTCTTFLRV
jgi:hypothetical protein